MTVRALFRRDGVSMRARRTWVLSGAKSTMAAILLCPKPPPPVAARLPATADPHPADKILVCRRIVALLHALM